VIRRLVVNADDLGLTMGVNDGIFAAHDRGILTSASLLANAPATIDAIDRARRRPSLGIGAHLTLIDGAPMLAPNRVSTLVEENGRFRATWTSFLLACLRGRLALDEAERELGAQIDRIRADGIRLTHLDAHKHVHAFPPLFAAVVRLAIRFDIPVVRIPYERWSSVVCDPQHRHRARRQALENIAMLPWARRDYRIAWAQDVCVPQFVGRVQTGIMSAESLEATLLRLRPGVTELMVHPGYVDDELRQTATRLLLSRAKEVELLSATATRDILRREAIQLVRHDVVLCRPPLVTGVRHVS
jgi:chitin disaccharide deacetylase